MKRKGVSLIVLAITIIVMATLAGAVIITLENSGMINLANKTVAAMDVKNIQMLATTLWATASMDGLEGEDLTEAVIEGLKRNNIDLNKVDINVTEDGVKITEVQSGIKFGKVYRTTDEDVIGEMILYQDGSASTWTTYITGEMTGASQARYMPAGSFAYTDTTIKLVETDEVLNVVDDGKRLVLDEMEFTLINVTPGKIKKGVPYVSSYAIVDMHIIFENDGSISVYQDGEMTECVPSNEITYINNAIIVGEEILLIYPTGKKVGITEGIVFEIEK